MSYFDDRTDKDVSNPVHGEGDARRRSYELNDKYAGKDNTPSEENKPPEEDYSLNDDRRVKVLSPGTLVAKRFFRNRLAVVGLTILAVMFVFCLPSAASSAPTGRTRSSTVTISSSRNTPP